MELALNTTITGFAQTVKYSPSLEVTLQINEVVSSQQQNDDLLAAIFEGQHDFWITSKLHCKVNGWLQLSHAM